MTLGTSFWTEPTGWPRFALRLPHAVAQIVDYDDPAFASQPGITPSLTISGGDRGGDGCDPSPTLRELDWPCPRARAARGHRLLVRAGAASSPSTAAATCTSGTLLNAVVDRYRSRIPITA